MQLGITTFVETTADQHGNTVSHAQRIREVVEEAKLADAVGLDYYGIGEHHREDFAASNPEMILAAAASVTENITLGSAVTVLSSDDPVRTFQAFATLDALSNGRAEIMIGRGSFTESFPMFGYDLKDYHTLFEEKLAMLLEIQKNPDEVHWEKIQHTYDLDGLGVYPLIEDSRKLAISIGTGGNPESTIRAAKLGLPIAYAIIGGELERFAPLVNLYKKTMAQFGHELSADSVSSHSHGFIAKTDEEALEKFWYPTQKVMNQLGRERGWPPYTRAKVEKS